MRLLKQLEPKYLGCLGSPKAFSTRRALDHTPAANYFDRLLQRHCGDRGTGLPGLSQSLLNQLDRKAWPCPIVDHYPLTTLQPLQALSHGVLTPLTTSAHRRHL